MDIETAANIGETVGGIAILFTLLFGLRQMKYWNENRRYEISRNPAHHMNNPLIHRGFSVSTNKLHVNLTIQEMVALSREEKDAMNAMMIGMNDIGLLGKNGHLSLGLVEAFCGPYVRVFGTRWRRAVEVFTSASMFQNDKPIEAVWGGLYWLMDTFQPSSLSVEE
jgi:hypothetical protein